MFESPAKPVFCLRDGKLGEISSLCFRKEENNINTLYSGCSNGNIVTWNLKSFRVSSIINGHDGKGILWLGCHDKQILSQGRDGFIRAWDCETMKECDKTRTSNVGFCKCSITQNGTIALPSDKSNEILLKSTKNGLNQSTITLSHRKKQHGMCMCLKISENASQINTIFAGYENGNVIQWDARNNKTPLLDTKIHKEPVMCLDFDEHKQRGVSGSPDDLLCVWNLAKGFEKLEKSDKQITNPGISSVRIRQDGRILGVGGWDSRIRLFGWKTLKPLVVLDFHTKTVQCVEFSPGSVGDHGVVMAAGSNDGKISLWDLYGKCAK